MHARPVPESLHRSRRIELVVAALRERERLDGIEPARRHALREAIIGFEHELRRARTSPAAVVAMAPR